MKQNVVTELSNPINWQFWHHSCIWLKELPQGYGCHIPYFIFRNKQDIKHFLFILTLSYHWKTLYQPHCWCSWVKFTHTGHVILQLILYKLWSKMLQSELYKPINCQFWHHSCIWLEDLHQDLVSHPYFILRNKQDIKHFLFILTLSYHWETLYQPHYQ